MSPAGPAPMMPTRVAATLPSPAGGGGNLPIEEALITEALVGVDHEVEHPQQLRLLALGQRRDQQAVHANSLWDQPLRGAHPRRRQAEQVAPAIPRIPEALDQPAR